MKWERRTGKQLASPCRSEDRNREPNALVAIHPPQHPDSSPRENQIAEPNTLRREKAIFGLIHTYCEKRIINDENRQKADEKAGDKLAETHLHRDRYADQHEAQAAKSICPAPPGLSMEPEQTLLPYFYISLTRLPCH